MTQYGGQPSEGENHFPQGYPQAPGYPAGAPGYPAGAPGYPTGAPGYPGGAPGYQAGGPGYPPGQLPPNYYGGQTLPPPPPSGRKRGGKTIVLVLVIVLLVVGGGATAAWWALNDKSRGTVAAAPAHCVNGTFAVLGDASGQPDEIGPAAVNMVKLAAEEYHAAHPDCTASVRAFDSGGDPTKAGVLAKQIVADPTILAVVGPLFSREGIAVSPVLDQAGVPMINPSVSSTVLGTEGLKSFHRTVGTDADTGTAMAKYIKSVNKNAKAYVIDDGSTYGLQAATAARSALTGQVVGSQAIRDGQRDFSTLAASIKDSGATVIAFAGFSEEAAALRKAVNAAGGSDIDLVAGPGLLDALYVTEAGEAGKDTIVVCACTPGAGLPDAFKKKLAAKSETQAGVLVGESYDAATALMAGLAKGKNTRAGLDAFLDTYSASGVTGPIAFQAGGDLRGTPPEWYFVTGTDGFFGKSRVQ